MGISPHYGWRAAARLKIDYDTKCHEVIPTVKIQNNAE